MNEPKLSPLTHTELRDIYSKIEKIVQLSDMAKDSMYVQGGFVVDKSLNSEKKPGLFLKVTERDTAIYYHLDQKTSLAIIDLLCSEYKKVWPNEDGNGED